MDDFEEFSRSLNQKPENTRSSLIEPQARSIESGNIDFEMVNHNQSEQPNIYEDPSIRYLQRTPFSRTYNSSGKPLHLSDFRNDLASKAEHFSENNYNNRTNGPADSWFSKTDGTSNFRDNDLLPYDDSGRTFNLTEFRSNNSNSQQHLTYTNDTSIPNLNTPKSRQGRTYNANSSGITIQHSQPTEYTAFPRRELKYGQNDEMESTLPLQLVTRRNHLFENLVKDSYFPGIIVDTVNGVIDFNKIAFGIVFGCGEIPLEIDQKSVPMSVLEAFDLRIEYEQNLRNDLEKRKLFCSDEFKKEQTEKGTVGTEDEVLKEASESITYWKHRDELKLASTIDIDLMTKVSNFPETPLTEAINCLLKAEKMNNFDRNVHLAEEAIRTALDGQQELAALKSTCSFKLDLRKDETKTTNSYEPLAIISYIGTTKPNNE